MSRTKATRRSFLASSTIGGLTAVSTCHLGNISMRPGRKLQWNAESELFVNDSEADKLLRREQRSGFEID